MFLFEKYILSATSKTMEMNVINEQNLNECIDPRRDGRMAGYPPVAGAWSLEPPQRDGRARWVATRTCVRNIIAKGKTFVYFTVILKQNKMDKTGWRQNTWGVAVLDSGILPATICQRGGWTHGRHWWQAWLTDANDRHGLKEWQDGWV